ncbi:hypothetical protein ACFE04_022553 [Oxalis oulophora]
MAFKKSLVERLFNVSRISNCRISTSSAAVSRTRRPQKSNIAPDPGDSNSNGSLFRRFLYSRSSSASPAIAPQPIWIGDKTLTERIKEMDISSNRIRLDSLTPPPSPATPAPVTSGLTGEDVRKLLRVAQMEMVKEILRNETDNNCIPYSDLVRVCTEVCSDPEQGIRVASMLDQSGSVIVLGNVVFIRPEQVTRAIEGLIPLPYNKNDPRKKEFEQLAHQMSQIDEKADALVRRELWAGLGYLMAQTVGFMRLTFWELSWDVMEPICFFVTSMYFMGAYTFFLRTAKEPSFEGFYQSRFAAKQKKLIKMDNFDVQRYNELRKIFHPYDSTSVGLSKPASSGV